MLTNTQTKYGFVARFFHWSIALLIFSALGLGVWGDNIERTAESVDRLKIIYSLHKTIGVTIFFVAFLRIAWALSQPRPVAMHPERKLESFIAEVVHWALYGALLIMPFSGWVMHSAEVGFAPIWWPFGQNLPFIAKSETIALAAGAVHSLSSKIIFATVGLHVIGALKHAIVDRDDVLARMTRGREAGDPNVTSAVWHAVPFAAAALLWSAVLIIALSTGQGHDHDHDHGHSHEHAHSEAANSSQDAASPTDPLAEGAANIWSVQEGQLAIEIVQLGSAVAGRFDRWDAEISYDQETQSGDVNVVIDTTSLELGSVTGQAQGPEFFDTQTFATAVFSGPITQGPDGQLQVEGQLELIGNTAPVVLTFELAIEDDVAVMTGETVLDRRDFSMGVDYKTDSDVGFYVDVQISLTATK